MKVHYAVVVVPGVLGVMAIALACSSGHGNRTSLGDSLVATATAAERDEDVVRTRARGESSPFIAGVWKFIQSDGGTPTVDTEFRFINPTNLTVNLEYAFFELDGTFCGCDRDVLPPNKTTVYTVLGESLTASPATNANFPFQFGCKGTSGALKAFVFKNKGPQIFLDDTTQVGFQTHAFGGIIESGTSPNFNFLVGSIMTQASMQGVAITDSTFDDIRSIHQQCLVLQGPLQ